MSKRLKLSKPQIEERRDVTIKRFPVATWRRARVAALGTGTQMADFVAAAIEAALKEANHAN